MNKSPDCTPTPHCALGVLTALANMLGYDMQPRNLREEPTSIMQAMASKLSDEELSKELALTQRKLYVYSQQWRALLTSSRIPYGRLNAMMDEDRPLELRRLSMYRDALVLEKQKREDGVSIDFTRYYTAFSDWLQSAETLKLVENGTDISNA